MIMILREGDARMTDEDQELSPILDEDATSQQIIPFEGDDLAAVMTPSGDIYISVNGMCAALGLVARGQYIRIQRTPSLAKGLRRIPLKLGRSTQRVNCLRIDKVALWIAGMETSRIKPEYREKIETYQEELAPMATRLFMRVMGIETTATAPQITDPTIEALYEQYNTFSAVVLDLRDHLTHLSEGSDAMRLQLDDAVRLLEALTGDVNKMKAKTAGLTPAQQSKVQEAVEVIVSVSEGAMDYATVYAAIKRRFKVASYKQIPDSQYEAVLTFLRGLWSHVKSDDAPEQGKLL